MGGSMPSIYRSASLLSTAFLAKQFSDGGDSKVVETKIVKPKEVEDAPLYHFNVVTADGKNVNLKTFRGKVVLIFNMGRKSKYVG